MKKYELTEETISKYGKNLYRIRALKDFLDVKKGDLGGFVESEKNLSQEGDAWVYDEACVYGEARVSGKAWVLGEACVYGGACVYDEACVYGGACVYGEARVSGKAEINEQYDYLIVSNIGSRGDITTFFRNKDNSISVTCGCFQGNLTEFEEKVKSTHKDNIYAKQYEKAIELAKISIMR